MLTDLGDPDLDPGGGDCIELAPTRARVRDHFLGPAELRKYLELMRRLISQREGP